MAIFKRTINGEQSDTYYFKITFQGKQYLRNTWTSDKAKAQQLETAWLRKLREGKASDFLEALQGLRGRRACCTIGAICDAWDDESVQIMKDDKGNRRVAAELRRVVAYARNMWKDQTLNIGETA